MKITLRAIQNAVVGDCLEVRMGGSIHTYKVIEIITEYLPNPAIELKHQLNGEKEIIIFDIKRKCLINDKGFESVKFIQNMATYKSSKISSRFAK
jgi:hypothetical protein